MHETLFMFFVNYVLSIFSLRFHFFKGNFTILNNISIISVDNKETTIWVSAYSLPPLPLKLPSYIKTFCQTTGFAQIYAGTVVYTFISFLDFLFVNLKTFWLHEHCTLRNVVSSPCLAHELHISAVPQLKCVKTSSYAPSISSFGLRLAQPRMAGWFRKKY